MNFQKIIENALAEDIGSGDITLRLLMFPQKKTEAVLVVKENGIIAGLEVAKNVFKFIDKEIVFEKLVNDGDFIEKGSEVAKIIGNSSSILQGERVALNFLQRMSGIATKTNQFVKKIGNIDCKLLDTRKTTPLLRIMEKMAVSIGGGYNHRFGLYDMIMLKENHIKMAGGIIKAVQQIKERNISYKIEVEVTNLNEAKEAFDSKVDRIMLDNMKLDDMRKAVKLFKGKIEIEASGNVNISTVKEIAETGVDFISCGALTHSYKSLDISLLFKE